MTRSDNSRFDDGEQIQPEPPTDIWFRSALSLHALAVALGATIRLSDAEDRWEWVVADLGAIAIDITRDHRTAPDLTDTRIFRSGSPAPTPFASADLDQIVVALRAVGVDQIYIGRWSYVDDDDFDKVVHFAVPAVRHPAPGASEPNGERWPAGRGAH